MVQAQYIVTGNLLRSSTQEGPVIEIINLILSTKRVLPDLPDYVVYSCSYSHCRYLLHKQLRQCTGTYICICQPHQVKGVPIYILHMINMVPGTWYPHILVHMHTCTRD